MKNVIVAAAVVLLTGCASAPRLPQHLDVQRRVGEEPAIGQVQQKSVGEVIYEVFNYDVITDTSTRLLGHISVDVLAADFELGPDDALVATTDKGVKAHCTAQRVLRVAGEPNTAHVCLRDQDSDGTLDVWRAPDGPPARWKWAALKHKVDYKEDTRVDMAQGRGFRYELLYQGLSSGVISILYREYLDSLMRPAFQQDLSYTLDADGGADISFRALQITVHSADNSGIRYTVNRGLSAPSP